jgi:hypothetical protein
MTELGGVPLKEQQQNICEYIRDMSTGLFDMARNNKLVFLAEMLAYARHEAERVANGEEPTPGLDLGLPKQLAECHRTTG